MCHRFYGFLGDLLFAFEVGLLNVVGSRLKDEHEALVHLMRVLWELEVVATLDSVEGVPTCSICPVIKGSFCWVDNLVHLPQFQNTCSKEPLVEPLDHPLCDLFVDWLVRSHLIRMERGAPIPPQLLSSLMNSHC